MMCLVYQSPKSESAILARVRPTGPATLFVRCAPQICRKSRNDYVPKCVPIAGPPQQTDPSTTNLLAGAGYDLPIHGCYSNRNLSSYMELFAQAEAMMDKNGPPKPERAPSCRLNPRLQHSSNLTESAPSLRTFMFQGHLRSRGCNRPWAFRTASQSYRPFQLC